VGRPQTGLSPIVKQLRPHHKSLARALVGGGLTPGELCTAFGFTPGHMSRILQSPLFKAEVDRLERMADGEAMDLRASLRDMAERSLEVLDEDLEIPVTSLQLRYLRNKTAMDVLDRVGLRKNEASMGSGNTSLQQIQINVANMSTDALREQVMTLVRSSEQIDDDVA